MAERHRSQTVTKHYYCVSVCNFYLTKAVSPSQNYDSIISTILSMLSSQKQFFLVLFFFNIVLTFLSAFSSGTHCFKAKSSALLFWKRWNSIFWLLSSCSSFSSLCFSDEALCQTQAEPVKMFSSGAPCFSTVPSSASHVLRWHQSTVRASTFWPLQETVWGCVVAGQTVPVWPRTAHRAALPHLQLWEHWDLCLEGGQQQDLCFPRHWNGRNQNITQAQP